MDQFDELLHQRAAEESFPLPEDYAGRVFQTCAALDENSRRRQRRHWETWAAAALALFITIPNVSPAAAAAMAEIPGLGALVKVVTFRSYAYNDGHSSMDISVPELSGSDAADTVNQEVRAYTDELLTQFYKDCERIGNGYQDLRVSSVVLTNTDTWFTLRIDATQTEASSYAFSRFYHIDKATGQMISSATGPIMCQCCLMRCCGKWKRRCPQIKPSHTSRRILLGSTRSRISISTQTEISCWSSTNSRLRQALWGCRNSRLKKTSIKTS